MSSLVELIHQHHVDQSLIDAGVVVLVGLVATVLNLAKGVGLILYPLQLVGETGVVGIVDGCLVGPDVETQHTGIVADHL